MRSQTNELAFEQAIEKALCGVTSEELAQNIKEPFSYGYKKRFYIGKNSDFNKTYAIDEKRFWHFLESTQEEELNKLKRDTNSKSSSDLTG